MWTDPRLAWNPEDFGGAKDTRINAKDIWLPDITTYNTISEMKPMTNGFQDLTNAVVKSSGFVIFTPQMLSQVKYSNYLLTLTVFMTTRGHSQYLKSIFWKGTTTSS